MYKTIIIICISILLLASCNDSSKKTGQINDYTNNENQAGDGEGYISSGDEGIFLENTDIVIEGIAEDKLDSSGQVSSDNPLNF